MIELTDAKIAGILKDKLNFPMDRVVYGNFYTATNYWTRYNADKPGIARLPYMAFFRTFRFSEVTKKSEEADIIDFDDVSRPMKIMPVMFAYIIEMMTSSVYEANLLIKRWMMFCGTESAISFVDGNGNTWKWRIIPEDPEDNSDLDQEDDLGRVVRTTLNFQVESVFFIRDVEIAGPILEILSNIHGYYDVPENSVLITTGINVPIV